MNTHPLLAGLQQSPDYFLQNLDLVNRDGLVVHISRETYRQAVFLDQRMFLSNTRGARFSFDDLLGCSAALPLRPALYIFHVGHCGSTLLSRLLGEIPGCLALREPLSYLALAMARREMHVPDARLDPASWQALFDMVTRLNARCYADNELALIKNTSVCGNLLQPALASHPDAKVILLYMDLATWLAAMLCTSGTRQSLQAFAKPWWIDFTRLSNDEPIRLPALNDVQRAVMGWAAMLLTFRQAALQYPDRIRWLNFDAFLEKPIAELRSLTAFLGLPATDRQIDDLMAGPIPVHYAKNDQRTFNVTVRNRQLAESRGHYGAEIHAGLQWFEELAQRIPGLAAAGPG